MPVWQRTLENFPSDSQTDRALCSAMRACGVDHEVDDFLADATVLQIDDFSSRQMILCLGIADLAENDFVTDPRLYQRFHIRQAKRSKHLTAIALRNWLR